MSSLSEKVEQLALKANKIKALIQSYKKQNEQLLEENDLLVKKIDKQNGIIKSLEEKIKISEINKTLEKGKDKKQIEQVINEMMREIDKCLKLLDS